MIKVQLRNNSIEVFKRMLLIAPNGFNNKSNSNLKLNELNPYSFAYLFKDDMGVYIGWNLDYSFNPDRYENGSNIVITEAMFLRLTRFKNLRAITKQQQSVNFLEELCKKIKLLH